MIGIDIVDSVLNRRRHRDSLGCIRRMISGIGALPVRQYRVTEQHTGAFWETDVVIAAAGCSGGEDTPEVVIYRNPGPEVFPNSQVDREIFVRAKCRGTHVSRRCKRTGCVSKQGNQRITELGPVEPSGVSVGSSGTGRRIVHHELVESVYGEEQVGIVGKNTGPVTHENASNVVPVELDQTGKRMSYRDVQVYTDVVGLRVHRIHIKLHVRRIVVEDINDIRGECGVAVEYRGNITGDGIERAVVPSPERGLRTRLDRVIQAAVHTRVRQNRIVSCLRSAGTACKQISGTNQNSEDFQPSRHTRPPKFPKPARIETSYSCNSIE